MKTDVIRREIAGHMGERRLPHVLGVEEECGRLAELFALSSQDRERLIIAALLHDITKYYSEEEHLRFLEGKGVFLTDDSRRCVKTLHALSGAYRARELYPDAVDEEVFTAIRYHTTGRAGMGLLEKLLYLADYIEPTRTFEDCVELRNYFYDRLEKGLPKEQVLNEALLLSLDMTLADLTKQNKPIHVDTLEAKADLVKTCR